MVRTLYAMDAPRAGLYVPPKNFDCQLLQGSVRCTGGQWTHNDGTARSVVAASWGAAATALCSAVSLTNSATNYVILTLDTTASPKTCTISAVTSIPAYSSGVYHWLLATVVVDGAPRITSYSVHWHGGNIQTTTSDGIDPLPDDHTLVERDITAGAVTVADRWAVKNWNYEDAAPSNTKTLSAIDDYIILRQTNDETPGNDSIATTQADPIFMTWGNVVSNIAADIVATGAPWDAGSAPWDAAEAIDHGNLSGLDDDDHDGATHPYLHIGASGTSSRNACHASCQIGDSSGDASIDPNARKAYESDGTESLNWNEQRAAISDVPTAGSATAADNATAINLILAALRAYKITAT